MKVGAFLTLLAVSLLSSEAAWAQTRSVCKTGGSGVNVRTAPSIHSGRATAISEGRSMEMLGLSQNGSWVKVRVGGVTGWVNRRYVCGGGSGSGSSGGNGGGGGSSAGSGASSGGSGGDAGSVGSGAAPDASGVVNPVPGSCRSSRYGWRRDPFHGTRRFHDGSDFAAPNGTPMRAMQSGTVVHAGRMRGYGYAVIVRHDNADGSSTFSLYGHMCCGRQSNYGRSSIRVRTGDRVNAGDVIGQVGTTGRSTGPHLHLLMRHVPRNAAAGYRTPSSSQFFSRTYSVNPENYISIGGCGGRGGVGGEDHDHDINCKHDQYADEAGAAGYRRD